jgi:hypothetical protein
MTEPGGVLLGRPEMERAFRALADRLARRGVIADIFVVGGAAMTLAYNATRVTRDVDAILFLTVSYLKKRDSWRRTSDCRRGG